MGRSPSEKSQLALPIDPKIAARIAADSSNENLPSTLRAAMLEFRTLPDGRVLSTQALQKRAGITYNTIRSVMLGYTRYLQLRTGLKLAAALERSPWWVLTRIDHMRALSRPYRLARKALKLKKRTSHALSKIEDVIERAAALEQQQATPPAW